MILIASYGCYKLKTDFKVTFLISEDSDINNYFIAKDKYFDSGFTVTFFVSNPELDFSSIETQQKIIQFEEAIQKNKFLDENWFITNTFTSWYKNFHHWVSRGECYALRAGIDPFEKGINPDKFYDCLWEFFEMNPDEYNERDILFNDEKRKEYKEIQGYKISVGVRQIKNIELQGPQFLRDMRFIEENFGVKETFSYAPEYLDFE